MLAKELQVDLKTASSQRTKLMFKVLEMTLSLTVRCTSSYSNSRSVWENMSTPQLPMAKKKLFLSMVTRVGFSSMEMNSVTSMPSQLMSVVRKGQMLNNKKQSKPNEMQAPVLVLYFYLHSYRSETGDAKMSRAFSLESMRPTLFIFCSILQSIIYSKMATFLHRALTAVGFSHLHPGIVPVSPLLEPVTHPDGRQPARVVGFAHPYIIITDCMVSITLLALLIIINTVMSKQKQAYTMEQTLINNKQFRNPKFNLFDCQKYMLPKLDTAPVHHTFYQPQELEQMYKQMKIDPDQINHNLDKTISLDRIKSKKSDHQISDLSLSSNKIVQDSVLSEPSSEDILPKIKRPILKQTGYTHFIHIPLWDALKDLYINEIVPRIEEEDRDLLMPLSSMHMTVLVFRLKKLQDLPLWSQVLKSAKKTKLSIKGVNIFPIKKNYAKVLFLNIKGCEDLIDRVVSKAIQLHLINQSQLSHIKFDKVSGTYKAEPHISLLRTKGEDLFDFTQYLKILNKVSIAKATATEIRLSVIGSHDGSDYFNQEILQI